MCTCYIRVWCALNVRFNDVCCRINNADALLILQHQIGFDQVTAIVSRTLVYVCAHTHVRARMYCSTARSHACLVCAV